MNGPIQLNEADLEETFARSSGPGGQHVNKVSSSVTLRHCPTGISVTVQDSRSQAANRRLARERLAGAIAQHILHDLGVELAAFLAQEFAHALQPHPRVVPGPFRRSLLRGERFGHVVVRVGE